VETVASARHIWVADMASWQWETKRSLLNEGALNGDVAIFGTSVLFHGLDPTNSNATGAPGRVVNLALNGMMLQHETQLLRERLASPTPPSAVVVEFRHVSVEQSTWISGPYFRFWASAPDFFESRFYYWNLPYGIAFAENRISTVFRFREGVDNWIFESARLRAPASQVLQRNEQTSKEMRAHAGQARAVFENDVLKAPEGAPPPREWVSNPAGVLWLYRFLDLASAHHLRVVLLIPPSPPYLVEMDGPGGYRQRLDAQVAEIRSRYPDLNLELFEMKGFAVDDFADPVHMSARGRERMSADFAAWLAGYRQRQHLTAPWAK